MLYAQQTYRVIGACMEVHSILGKGHLEVVYADALEVEFKIKGIPFKREVRYDLLYKNELLPHFYYADFVVYDKLILEIKAVANLDKGHVKQTLNYLAASKLKIGLIVNFGENSLAHKRVIL